MNADSVFECTVARFIAVVLTTLALSACKEGREQSIHFYDAQIERKVIQKMEDDGIPFRLEENAIWYSIDNGKKVQEIFNAAVAQRPMQYGFYNNEKQKKFISLLRDQGIIVSTESSREPPYMVYVPNEYRDKSEEVFQEVLRNN